MTSPSERDPLLRVETGNNIIQTPYVEGSKDVEKKHKQGPLEISRANRNAILAGIWTASFLGSLNTTLVATLLSSISSEFQQSNQASWLGTSYLLATCTFTPLYGRLSNVLGRRGACMTAVIFAALGTLACGMSTSLEMLIAARFLGGLGGGGIFTTSTIVLSDMYSMRDRGLATGLGSIFNGLGMGLGGPIGGYISDRFGWRWAFLMQTPFFAISIFFLLQLKYVTPGKSKSAKDVLKRIDYGGTVTLFGMVLSMLVFLSNKYNEEAAWSSSAAITPLVTAALFFILFIYVELRLSPEPVLAPFLLEQKVPVLVGFNNFLVSLANFAIQYFFPLWFETVALTSASIAGLHIMPNSISMSCGSLFAGWWMHRTGKYKKVNMIFGLFPFMGAMLITFIREDSGFLQQWFSIIPLGFGNAVVLQTTLIALLAHLPQSHMAVGTGFGQLFRGVGQVGGVAVSSAIFQSILDRELRLRISGPDSDDIIRKIRHSSKIVASLDPVLQRAARDSFAISCRAVFIFAACCTFTAYLVRWPIPEKDLDTPDEGEDEHIEDPLPIQSDGGPRPYAEPGEDTRQLLSPVGEEEAEEVHDAVPVLPRAIVPRRRRLSTYQSFDGGLDLEDEEIGGSARSLPVTMGMLAVHGQVNPQLHGQRSHGALRSRSQRLTS